MKPSTRPANPCFGSGPTAKRPGWSLAALEGALVGRSHRAAPAKARLAQVLERSHAMLGLPEDYLIGIVPASDTGAFETAMWSLLGARGVDLLCWESFGKGWLTDAQKQLKLADLRVFEADFGALPDLSAVGAERDVVFTWNGTTSGVRVPHGDWIAAERSGLTLCDATLGRLRDGAALGQARRGHLLLAKSAGWRGATWHVDLEPTGRRPAREPYAAMAAAQVVPADQGR